MHHGNEYGRQRRDNHGRSIDVSVLLCASSRFEPHGFEPTVGWFESGWLVSNPVGLVVNPGVKFLAPVPVCVTVGAST